MISYNLSFSKVSSFHIYACTKYFTNFHSIWKDKEDVFLFFIHWEEILELETLWTFFLLMQSCDRRTKMGKFPTRLQSNIIETVIILSSNFYIFPSFSSLLPFRSIVFLPALLPFVLLPRCCVSTRRSFPFFTPASFLFHRFHRFLPAFPFSTRAPRPVSSFLFPPSRSSSSLSSSSRYLLSERETREAYIVPGHRRDNERAYLSLD